MAECQRIKDSNNIGPTCSCPPGTCTLGITHWVNEHGNVVTQVSGTTTLDFRKAEKVGSYSDRTILVRASLNNDRVTCEIHGNPSACLDRARGICSSLLAGMGPWHFVQLDFNLPLKSDKFGQDLESPNYHIWQLEVMAVADGHE